MSVQYTGRGRGIHQECSVHRGISLSTPGDIIEYTGGYHEYTGGVQYSGGTP